MSQTATIELSPVAASVHTESLVTDQNASTLAIAGAVGGDAQAEEAASLSVTKRTTAIVTATTMLITGLGSYCSGLLTVSIPTIAQDVGLQQGLILWPSSMYHLISGCTLLIAGSMSDAIGAKPIYMIGCFLQAIFTMASGLSKTGAQLIVFRAFSGLALSFCLPSSVSIITGSLPAGKRRNIAFACIGMGQPVGFALGLTLGGVFTQSLGWQWGFYLAAIANMLVFAIAYFGLPISQSLNWRVAKQQLKENIDWTGGLLASLGLALLSYVLAAITTHASSDDFGTLNIVLLCIAVAIVPAFIFWMRRQEALNLPALIPNSIWQNKAFTTICLSILLANGSCDGFEQMMTLYFQYVRKISPLDTSLRFLPACLLGVGFNTFMGLVAHRISANVLTVTALTLSCVPTLLIAFSDPTFSYWEVEFVSVALSPVAVDCLFTISALLITTSFSVSKQGLAGGVFNTCVQIGQSIGLAFSSLISNRITAKGGKGGVLALNGGEDPSLSAHETSLLRGYRAAFWLLTGLNAFCVVLSIFGLKRIGKVGRKAD